MKRLLSVLALVCLGAGAQTARFPSTVATESDLKISRNFVRTKLRYSVSASQTDISVHDATNIVANMLLTVESEVVSVTSISGSVLTVVRGFDGTTAAAHSAGREIGHYPTAWEVNALRAEVRAIEAMLGTELSNVPNTSGARDIRNDGATCDGTDQNTAVQTALTNGHTRLFIPAGCTWVAPSGLIPAGLQIWGENILTSVIKSASTYTTATLQGGAGTQLYNLNLLGNTCTTTANECSIAQWINSSTSAKNIVSTGNGAYHTWCGTPGKDTTCVFFQNGENLGDAVNISNTQGVTTGNALRADNYGQAGVASVFATAMPGAQANASVISTRNFTGVSNPADAENVIHYALFDEYSTNGNLIQADQRTAAFAGNLLQANMGASGGSFTGYFTYLNNNGTNVYNENSAGATYQAGYDTVALGLIEVANGGNHNLAIGNTGFVKLFGATGSFEITGFSGCSASTSGRRLTVLNALGQTMIVRNQSASSASGNKVYIPQGDYTCPTANCVVELVCDGQGSPAQWIMKGAN